MSYRASISTIGGIVNTIVGVVSITIGGIVSITIVITTLREFFIVSRIRPYESFLYV